MVGFVQHILVDLSLGKVEAVVKRQGRHENVGQQEVQHGPKLVKVVLHGGARQQHAVGGANPPARLRHVRFLVLDFVPLVKHHRPPPLPRQTVLHGGAHDHVVGGDDYVVALYVSQHLPPQSLALLFVSAVQPHHPQPRAEPPELEHPRRQHAQGDDHQVGAPHHRRCCSCRCCCCCPRCVCCCRRCCCVSNSSSGTRSCSRNLNRSRSNSTRGRRISTSLRRSLSTGGRRGNFFVFESDVRNERDGLQRLAQPHLIRQDSVDAVVEAVDQPAQALQLVVPHGAAHDGGGLPQQRRGQRHERQGLGVDLRFQLLPHLLRLRLSLQLGRRQLVAFAVG
mmetsp:Transcript_41498/g.83841  ORF Transcript_41498/g.83841 Transcript_41498/m.83841 type:complete len:337 (+) Transcript_41498:444-1454(+)